MRVTRLALGLFPLLLCLFAPGAASPLTAPVETGRNNLVTELLQASSLAEPSAEFTFTRATEGWVFIAARFTGTGTATCTLDPASPRPAVLYNAKAGSPAEAVRYV